MERVTLSLLGNWQLTIHGQPVAAPAYEKGRALLAYLAIENRWLARETLGGLFWPDLDSHRANLRVVLANLRSVLQDNGAAVPCLSVRRDAIGINAGADWLDVTNFLAALPRCDGAGSAHACAPCLRRMEQAGALYRGELLAGLSLADCAEFDEWLQRQREALRRHAVALCGRLADCHEQYGDPDSALTFARRAAELDPWNEAVQRRLMGLLVRRGQSTAALQQYRELEASLARDIGIAPEPATQAIHRQIQEQAGGPVLVRSGDGDARDLAVAPHEVRRVVVLQVEDDLSDASALLDDEHDLVDHAATLDALLSRWSGQRFPTTGRSLGVVFGLAGDGEQAPRRALHMALEIAAAPVFRQSRIGLCEGPALIGPDSLQSIAASALPALAQRLALCGDPGDIVALESLAGESGGFGGFGRYVSVEPLPRRRFTGLAGEYAPCRLNARADIGNASDRLTFSTPFVGRLVERARLMAALDEVGKSGRAAFIEVSGPAGDGKSRLLAELAREHRAGGGEFRWIAHCPELCHVALGALREALRRRIGKVDATRPDGAQNLDRWLERLFTDQQAALRAPLRILLGHEGDGTAGISGRSLIDALSTLLFSPSQNRQPVLLVLDDLHWADEATRELLQLALLSPPAAPILVVMTSRLTGGVEATSGAPLTRITLPPLALAESLALIGAIDREQCIGTARRTELAMLSGGLPLCAEYIARTARNQPVSDASLFGVLHGLLDRLGSDKLALQAASVFGVGFGGAALRALLPEHDLAAALRQAELLAISQPAGRDAHAFRHALLRDCAYQSIPPKQRRDWHRKAAAWLVQQADAAPADIAQHFEAAQRWSEARDYWSKAADIAYRGEFAHDAREAAVRAIAAAAKDGKSTAADQAELELLAGFATVMAQGYGSKAAQQLFAPTVARQVGEVADETLFRALCGMAAAIPQGRRETLDIMCRLARMVRSPVHRMMVCYGFGSLLFWRGEFANSLNHLEEAIQIGEQIPAREWLCYSADNPVVACRALKAINLAFGGAAALAEDAAARAVAEARHEGRAHGLCFALTMAASVHLVLDRPEQVAALAAEGLDLATQRDFPLWRAYNTMFGLWVEARQGRLRLRTSFKLVSMHREFAAASRLSPVSALWFAACIFEALENWTLLDVVSGRAIRLAENGGDRFCLPDLLRQKALVRLARGDLAAAGRWQEQAFAAAEAMGSNGLRPRLERMGCQLAQ